jgi:formylglycine-generating enzyme required for sulfatase activity
VLRLHADKIPPPPHELNPDLPTPIEQALLKALAKRPDQRYQSAGAFARALREALAVAEQARQREAQLAEAYARLQTAVASEDWAAAETHCHAILALAPDYRDVPDLLNQAREAQAEQEEQLARLYQQARTALRRGRWEEAQERCDDVESLAGADYQDVRDLRRQAIAGLQRAQAERERQEGLAQLYERLQAAAAEGDWAEVLALGGRIQALDPAYRDVAGRMEQAHRELRRRGRRPVPAWVWGVGGVAVLGVMVLLVVFGSRWNEWFAQGPTETPTMAPSDTPTPTATVVTSTPAPTERPTRVPTLTLPDTWVRPTDEMVMVYVQGGKFEMGSAEGNDDERPVHTVALDAFWIDRTEVTNAQYALCVGDGICDEASFVNDADLNGDDYPVVGVSWYDADTYCEWVDARLPTEAEWEYAARGPEGHIYPWGDEDPTCDLAQYGECSGRTVPVGSLPDGASWCGALDLAGNVWEWVADWYGDYPSGVLTNPTGPSSGEWRVLRGGSWYNDPEDVRGAFRVRYLPGTRLGSLGFRCARGSE